MSSVAIVAPVYITNDEHFAFAYRTMASIPSQNRNIDTIAIVNKIRDNGTDQKWLEDNFKYIEWNDKNVLSRAWNKGAKKAFERGHKYALIINLDILFQPQAIDNLVQDAEEHPDNIIWSSYMWEDVRTFDQAIPKDEFLADAHFSCFMIDEKLFKEVGEFDEQFVPIYHEDCDMRRRVKLKGHTMRMTKKSWFYHLENGVLKGLAAGQKDAETQLEFQAYCSHLDVNRQRYLAKWGGPPYKEVFTQPYNGKPAPQI